MEEKLRALYYPYSRCQSEVGLKRALLVFDEVYFVDPIAQDIAYDNPSSTIIQNDPYHIWYRSWESAGQDESAFDWPEFEKLRDDYFFLQEQGAVSIVDPTSIVNEHPETLLASLRSTTEQDFHSRFDWINDPEILLWIVPKKRIPVSQNSALNIPFFDTTRLKLRPWGPGPNKLPDHLAALHVNVAFPMLTDQALLICDQFGLVPYTDDPKAYEHLVDRSFSILKKSSSTNLSFERDIEDLMKFERLSLGAIARSVPDESLERRSFKEICEYRNECKESLYRFRSRLWQLTSNLETDLRDKSAEFDMKRIIETEILPQLEVLEEELRSVYERMFEGIIADAGKATFKAASVSAPALTVAALTGVTAGQLVALGAASFLSGLGLSIPSASKYIREKREARRNFVHYLWNLK